MSDTDLFRAVSPGPPEGMRWCAGCQSLEPESRGFFDGRGEWFCGECGAPNGPDPDDGGGCVRCWGEGEIVVCCDDICQARKECIHGDGMGPCPDCNGGAE